MGIVRVVKPCVVTPSSTGIPTPLTLHEPYDEADEIVREFGWAFESDVEDATAEPGAKRAVRRR